MAGVADGANFRTSLVGKSENTFYKSMRLMLLKNNSFDDRKYKGTAIKDIKEKAVADWKARGGDGTFEDYVNVILTPGYKVDPADIDLMGIAASWATHKPVIIEGDATFSTTDMDNTSGILKDGAAPMRIKYVNGSFIASEAAAGDAAGDTPGDAAGDTPGDAPGPSSGPVSADPPSTATVITPPADPSPASKSFLVNPIVDTAAASVGVGTAAGTAGAAAAGVLGSGLGVAAGVGAAAGLGAAGVGALGAYGLDAINRSSLGKSKGKGVSGFFNKVRAGFGSTAAALRAARDQLVSGINLDVNIAGERVRLVLSGFNFKRHPDIASINDYYEDAGESQIALINKYFGKGSQFKADDPAALCDESEKEELTLGLEHRLSTIQDEIRVFSNNDEFSVQEVAKISHANRLIALIKKIQTAKGKCETLSETGVVVETPGVDTAQEERIEKIVKKFAFVVLKYFDPDLTNKGPYKDLLENIEKVNEDEAYIAGRANKPVFIQRLLGLDADLERLLAAKQEELLQKLKELLPNIDLDLDEQVEGQDPTPYDKVLKIMTFCVESYLKSSAEIARLTAELNKAAGNISRLEDELRDAIAAAALAATAAAAAAERAATDLANEIADKDAVAANLEAMTRERDAAVAGTAAALAEANQARDAANTQVSEIQEKLTAAQAEHAAATAAKESAENALAAAQTALAAAQDATTAAEAERDAARAELAAKTAELAGKVGELEALQGGKEAGDAATAGLQSELDQVKADLAQTNEALAAEKARAAAAAADAQAAANKAADALRESEEARAKAEADKNEYVGHLNSASDDYDAQKAKAEDLERQLAELSNKNADTSASSNASLAAANATIDALKRDLATARGDLEPLQIQLTTAQEAARKANAQLVECERASKELQDKYQALVTHANDTIEKELAKASSEMAALHAAGKGMDGMVAQLKASAAEHAQKIAALEEENRRLIAENAAKEAANNALAAEKAAVLRNANAQIAADLAAISAALDSGAPMPKSAQLQTLIDRINGLRGNKEAFNKNMCLLSTYVAYFMKLLFSSNVNDYNVLLEIVDKIRGDGTYMDVLNKLDPFLKIETADSARIPAAQKSEIAAYYNPPPSTKVMLEQKLGSPGTALSYSGSYRTLTINDYFGLFVVASQKYMQGADLPCQLSEAIRNPSGLGDRQAPRMTVEAPTPASVAPSYKAPAPSYTAPTPSYTAPAPARSYPTAYNQNDDDDNDGISRIAALARSRSGSPAPAVQPAPVRSTPGVKGTPGNPWTMADASAALKTLNTVLKVQKGQGHPPPGSPTDVKQYIRENNRPNQALLDAYCAYPNRDAVICSKYTSVKRDLNAVSRF
jgi:DNA repair exonuclease SbcCD ATPase subunit